MSGKSIRVLDIGRGEGMIIQHILVDGYDIYRHDFTRRLEKLRSNFGNGLLEDFAEHIKITEDDRHIPFESAFFDVLYANQVFEHVKFIDRMLEECARVLNPDGVLLINFPLATCPIEGHLKIPFAHWIPPGNLRIQYLRIWYALRLARKGENNSAREAASEADRYLREQTYYRFINEVIAVGEHWFESVALETNRMIEAKADMMRTNGGPVTRYLGNRIRQPGRVVCFSITHFHNAAFCLRRPRKGRS